MDITEATAKLVRLFKVPTVFINIEGGFSKKPRWSQKERRGKVYLTVKKVLTPDEIKGSSLPELVKIVSDNLSFDTTAWQKEKGLEYYDSSVQAEGIERVVYACSSCGSAGFIICETSKTSASLKRKSPRNPILSRENSLACSTSSGGLFGGIS